MGQYKQISLESAQRNLTRLRSDPQEIYCLDEKVDAYRAHFADQYDSIYKDDDEAAKMLERPSTWNRSMKETCLTVQAKHLYYLERSALESEIIAEDTLHQVHSFFWISSPYRTIYLPGLGFRRLSKQEKENVRTCWRLIRPFRGGEKCWRTKRRIGDRCSKFGPSFSTCDRLILGRSTVASLVE